MLMMPAPSATVYDKQKWSVFGRVRVEFCTGAGTSFWVCYLMTRALRFPGVRCVGKVVSLCLSLGRCFTEEGERDNIGKNTD